MEYEMGWTCNTQMGVKWKQNSNKKLWREECILVTRAHLGR